MNVCAGIHREHVLKQSFQIFLTAPTATLRRRLRVDFMEEPGIDGGGILREWIHLICNQVFSDKLGIFQLTNSTAHQGYWISRNAGKHCRNHLQVILEVQHSNRHRFVMARSRNVLLDVFVR